MRNSFQQEFAWLLDLPEEKGLKGPHNVELYFGEDDFDRIRKHIYWYQGIHVLGGIRKSKLVTAFYPLLRLENLRTWNLED